MFIIFLLLWILFNGRVTPEIILFGIAISGAVCGICHVLYGYSFQQDRIFFRKLPIMLRLFAVLLKEIVKANLAVVKMIYSLRTPSGCYVSFPAPLKHTLARVALADCITLTPGTITGLLEEGQYTVHCLDKSMAEGLEESAFVQGLREIEKETDA